MSLLDPENIKKHYQNTGSEYSDYAVLQKTVSDELVSRLDIINIDVTRVLDLGCGPGYRTKDLLKRFPKTRLTLLDISENMLKLAKKNRSWFSKVDLIRSNAASSELPDNHFDIVFSNLMLPQCASPDAVFKEVQRITRENGLVTFTTLGPDSFKELRLACEGANIRFDDFAFGHLTDMHDIGDALVRNGLCEPVLDVDILQLSFTTFSALWKELSVTGCILQTLSDEHLKILESHYPKTENGSFIVTFEIVYAQAWAGDGKSRARTPDEVHISIDSIKRGR